MDSNLYIPHSRSIIMAAEIPILLLVAALVGAALNVIRGASNSTEPFAIKKAAGAAVAATISAFAALSLFDVATLGGPVQTFIVGALAGFTADFGLSRLNK
jgi:hypothetical protein